MYVQMYVYFSMDFRLQIEAFNQLIYQCVLR